MTARISVAAGARINGKVSMEEGGKGGKVEKVDEEES